jgi:predicted regulator of Ras-like GTPase activity (Roadblock/LC7/MglB family)
MTRGRIEGALSGLVARRNGMTRAAALAQALDEFLAVSPEVEAAAVVSADGLPMASALPAHVEEDRLAAMSAALLILGERAAGGLGKGELSQVLVEGRDGYVVLMAAGDQAVLVVVTSTGAKAGLLLFEMRRMAARVAGVMTGGAPEAPSDRSDGMGSAERAAAPPETALTTLQ